MKHYMAVDAAGNILGEEVFAGGFPPACDLVAPKKCNPADHACNPARGRARAAWDAMIARYGDAVFPAPPADPAPVPVVVELAEGAVVAATAAPAAIAAPPVPVVDPRWSDPERGYAVFAKEMGDAPAEHSLTRFDSAEPFGPKNCAWTTTALGDPVPDAPGCLHHHARTTVALRKRLTPAFAAHIPFECPCPSSKGTCGCPAEKVLAAYVKNGAFVAKAVPEILLNGEPQAPSRRSAPIDVPMGAAMTLELRAPGVPAGHKLLLRCGRGSAGILRVDTELTFDGSGRTQPVRLVAPAQGATGWVFGASQLVRQFGVHLRGWSL